MSPTLVCPHGLPWVPAGNCCHVAAQISLPQQMLVHVCAAFPSCNPKPAQAPAKFCPLERGEASVGKDGGSGELTLAHAASAQPSSV